MKMRATNFVLQVLNGSLGTARLVAKNATSARLEGNTTKKIETLYVQDSKMPMHPLSVRHFSMVQYKIYRALQEEKFR
jgi:hypothetical protein